MNSIFELLYTFNSLYHDTYSTEYSELIFPLVGLLSAAITIALNLIFYAGLGRMTTKFSLRKHWGFFLIMNMTICFLIAFFIAKSEVYEVDGYLLTFSVLNMVYSLVFFIAISILTRKTSKYAKLTPF